MDIAITQSYKTMLELIPDYVLENYKIIFIPVPDIPEYHLTKLDFKALPAIQFLNTKIRPDFIRPLIFKGKKNSSLILMDRLGNHDFFTLMLMQGGPFVEKGFHDLSISEIKKTFTIHKEFIDFWAETPDKEKYSPRFSFNHDPHTADRPGLQSIDRFHAHFYFFRLQNLELNSKTNSFPLKNVVYQPGYKDCYDPGSPPLEKVILDLNKNCLKVPKKLEIIDESLLAKVKNGRGLGLNILYNGNVEYFTRSPFINYLVEMHSKMEKVFHDFMENALSYDPRSTLWYLDHEKAAQFIENISWLSPSTKSQLLEFIHCLKNLKPKINNYIAGKKAAKNLLAYRNLSYSLSIDLRDNDPTKHLINLCPKVFCELGGAGFFSLQGYNAIIIDRKKDIFFSNETILKRRELQQSFINRMTKINSLFQ